MQAADADDNGTADLWTVSDGAAATAWPVSDTRRVVLDDTGPTITSMTPADRALWR
ncbi:hypothetical protein [Actinoplanes awajinensis]|uniref:hypothetical protein n=1 Tax=Actinoplanes awajinensis TaxID=135946 RepID=UPI0012FB363F|nr:hypothetical protein [Actinoplanes awajinensis]